MYREKTKLFEISRAELISLFDAKITQLRDRSGACGQAMETSTDGDERQFYADTVIGLVERIEALQFMRDHVGSGPALKLRGNELIEIRQKLAVTKDKDDVRTIWRRRNEVAKEAFRGIGVNSGAVQERLAADVW